MTTSRKPPDSSAAPPSGSKTAPGDPRDARRRGGRLATALRENLKRRKAQARAKQPNHGSATGKD